MDMSLTGVERTFSEHEIIVSKTDPRGVITYANQVFMEVAGYTEEELLGKPHSIIRHPDMPRCVFQLLWDRIQAGQEIFAFVVNRAKNGDHYWVFAHVTPDFDPQSGRIVGYHSSRRVPRRSAIDTVVPIYQQLLDEEARHASKRDGISASMAMLEATLRAAGVSYDELVFSLT